MLKARLSLVKNQWNIYLSSVRSIILRRTTLPPPPPQFPWLVLAVFHISLAEWCGCPKTSIPRTLVSIDYLLSKQKIIVCYPDFRKRQSCWRYAFLIEFCIYGKGLNNAWRIFEWKRAKSKRSILCKWSVVNLFKIKLLSVYCTYDWLTFWIRRVTSTPETGFLLSNDNIGKLGKP